MKHERLIIVVEDESQADTILEVLTEGEEEGKIDFPFQVERRVCDGDGGSIG